MDRDDAPDEPDVRDSERDLAEYDPAPGRRFRATDSEATFVGDGDRWHRVVDRPDRGITEMAGISSITPPIKAGPRGFATVNHDVRARLVNYEAGYTKPVFHWSFDGGMANNYERRDVFEDLGLRPTLAISPSIVGEEDTVTWAQLRELQSEYGWGISNHGHRHERFDEIGPAEQEREIVDAVEAFRRHGVAHDHYMYSWGMAVGRSIVATLYPFAWGTVHAPEAMGIVDIDSPYALPRVLVEREDRVELEGAIDRAVANDTGMVLFGHNIRDGESVDDRGFETPVDLIRHLTEYVREAGGEWVDSVDEVVQYSKTPIRLSAGSEPVMTDNLVAESVHARDISAENVGTNAYQSTVQRLPVGNRTTVALDATRHDHHEGFDAEEEAVRVGRPGTYALVGSVHAEADAADDTEAAADGGGRATLGIVVDGSVEARSVPEFEPEARLSLRAGTHLDLAAGGTVALVASVTGEGGLETVPGADRTFLAVSRLG